MSINFNLDIEQFKEARFRMQPAFMPENVQNELAKIAADRAAAVQALEAQQTECGKATYSSGCITGATGSKGMLALLNDLFTQATARDGHGR